MYGDQFGEFVCGYWDFNKGLITTKLKISSVNLIDALQTSGKWNLYGSGAK